MNSGGDPELGRLVSSARFVTASTAIEGFDQFLLVCLGRVIGDPRLLTIHLNLSHAIQAR